MTNHPNRSKQQQAKHTPLARLEAWWQTGNQSDPTYAAGNTQFAVDVGFLLKINAELLAALKVALPYVERVADTTPTEMNRQHRQRQACVDAKTVRTIIEKVDGNTL